MNRDESSIELYIDTRYSEKIEREVNFPTGIAGDHDILTLSVTQRTDFAYTEKEKKLSF